MREFCFCTTACVVLALTLMRCAAEPLFFTQTQNLSWDQARSHCQACFKDLATVTPNSSNSIAQNITSDSWIGLRKNYNSTGNLTGLAWSHWADGAPLAFQNWYPGWPVFLSPVPQTNCCSCSCTCPAVTAPSTTSFPTISSTYQNSTLWTSSPGQSTTAAPVHAACVRTPMVMPDLPDPNKNYIADSCVAMLSIGAWVEKNCTDHLPFVCYEDHFFGQLSVTSISASGAILAWLPGPGNVSHYRLEVPGISLITNVSLTLTYNLSGLAAGTTYLAKVTAVKCGRDIDDPQVANFYTIPNTVDNLTVTTQMETSITLSWNRPVGSADFYLVKFNSQRSRSYTESTQVSGLTPGTLYTFTILTGVNDTSKWSDAAVISVYTKPDKVSSLLVSENTPNTLKLSWIKPVGLFDGYIVTVTADDYTGVHPFMVDKNEVLYTVQHLPPGTQVTLNVTAMVNNSSLVGDTVTVVNYTAPDPVSNLTLSTTDRTLSATWVRSGDNYSSYLVELRLDGNATVQQTNTVMVNSSTFNNLKTAAKYNVTVYTFSGSLKSPGKSSSIYTIPSPPTNAVAINWTKDTITFQWTPPLNIANITYSVKLSSSFWGQVQTYTVKDSNSYTFTGLTSGTNYTFEVRTVTDLLQSSPASTTQSTVANKVQIIFSMMCSSAESLYCASSSASDAIINKLNERFRGVLGTSVFWTIQKRDTEN